jgi:thymidylate kinase
MAKIVVFEGPDKVGKETQSKLLNQTLLNSGYRTIRVEVPSKMCPRTHKLIYKMLHNGAAKRWPNVFQFVQFLNKWLFQLTVLPSLLRANDVVIFDRWSLSAVIYGGATGVNAALNMWLYNRLMKADVTVVFSGKSYRRNTADDSYEKDNELQARVKQAYSEWAVAHPDDHLLVDNARAIGEIHHDIVIDLCMRGVP